MTVPRSLHKVLGRHLQQALGVIEDDKVARRKARDHLTRFEKSIERAAKSLAGTPDIDAMAVADRENEVPADAIEFIADDHEAEWGVEKADRYKGIATGKLKPLNLYRKDWLATLTKEKTRQEFEAIFKEFESFARARKADDLAKVSGKLVMEWRADLVRSGKASATINKRLTGMSSYWKHCMLHDAVAVNPFTGRRVEVVPTRERRRYTTDELERLFALADDQRRLEMAVALLGMRQSAQWLLRADHVEVIGGITCLRIPKVKKEKKDRLIPVPDVILPAVNKLVEMAHTRGGYLCAAPVSGKGKGKGNGVSKSRGSEPGRRFMRWLVAKGFSEDVDWHSFRRTCAWLLETAGLPENIAARVIGHSMGITFTLYSGDSDMGWMKPEMDKAFNRLPEPVKSAINRAKLPA
ncbi:tyrosine-type recombinase/integrase [Aestuariivirga sp.]|uniref:tyrosine-type recombinase/integrase n=1 Tax=Aestuariivirga sp. TaxID=2650926 RepID=UPI003593F8A1